MLHSESTIKQHCIILAMCMVFPEHHTYTDSSVTVHLHKESEKIRIKRGVRQGDTISPKLFTATLESIFRRLNWENKGVKIDGEFLSNLRFADGIFLCTETPQELHNRCYKNYPMKVDEWVLR